MDKEEKSIIAVKSPGRWIFFLIFSFFLFFFFAPGATFPGGIVIYVRMMDYVRATIYQWSVWDNSYYNALNVLPFSSFNAFCSCFSA